jgi:hypothetical protein
MIFFLAVNICILISYPALLESSAPHFADQGVLRYLHAVSGHMHYSKPEIRSTQIHIFLTVVWSFGWIRSIRIPLACNSALHIYIFPCMHWLLVLRVLMDVLLRCNICVHLTRYAFLPLTRTLYETYLSRYLPTILRHLLLPLPTPILIVIIIGRPRRR